MTFDLYTEAVLTHDLPEHNLRRGDVVVIVDHHVARDGEEGYSIEVFNATGDTIAMATVPADYLEFPVARKCSAPAFSNRPSRTVSR